MERVQGDGVGKGTCWINVSMCEGFVQPEFSLPLDHAGRALFWITGDKRKGKQVKRSILFESAQVEKPLSVKQAEGSRML